MKKKLLPIILCLVNIISYSQSTWQEVYSEGFSHILHCITFSDSLTGYAVGQGGRIVKTTNGGNNWDTLTSCTKQTLFYVCFNDKNTGYACGDGGTIIKTNDGGKTWKLQNILTTDCLNIISIIDKDTVFVFGVRGRMLKTTDGGKNWQSLKKLTFDNITSSQFLNKKIGYFATYGNDSSTLFKTKNTGRIWKKICTTHNEFTEIYFLDTLTGYSTGFFKEIYKTTDGGKSWKKIFQRNEGYIFRNIYFIDSNTGYVCDDNYILNTIDAGKTWVNYSPNSKYHFCYMCINSNGNIYALASFGKKNIILKCIKQ